MVFGHFKKNSSVFMDKGSKKNREIIYNDEENKNKVSPIYTEYTEEIDAHFLELFPGREVYVFGDENPEYVNIDINIMYPSDEEDFYVLYTTGMSAAPMNIPDEIKNEYPELARSELFLLLPSSWNVDDFNSKYPKEENFWPVKLLRLLGRFPHEYFAWFGPGHSIGINNEYQTFAKNTKLCSAMLVALGDDISIIKCHDGTLISSHLVLPLYKEEMDYKLTYGYDALLNKYGEVFNQDDGTQWVIDIKRKNVAI